MFKYMLFFLYCKLYTSHYYIFTEFLQKRNKRIQLFGFFNNNEILLILKIILLS